MRSPAPVRRSSGQASTAYTRPQRMICWEILAQGFLTAGLMEFLEAIEAVAGVAQDLAGLGDVADLSGQFQEADFVLDDLLNGGHATRGFATGAHDLFGLGGQCVGLPSVDGSRSGCTNPAWSRNRDIASPVGSLPPHPNGRSVAAQPRRPARPRWCRRRNRSFPGLPGPEPTRGESICCGRRDAIDRGCPAPAARHSVPV